MCNYFSSAEKYWIKYLISSGENRKSLQEQMREKEGGFPGTENAIIKDLES